MLTRGFKIVSPKRFEVDIEQVRYKEGHSIIKIDNEEMKITNIQGNEITVVRGYNNTNRTVHVQNAIIYCVGIADIGVAHKFFVKNDPPAGLPTQKKADNKLVLVANEEPL